MDKSRGGTVFRDPFITAIESKSMSDHKNTAEHIMGVLRSIESIGLDPELEVMIRGEVFTSEEFVRGSFTRALLELIEEYIEE